MEEGKVSFLFTLWSFGGTLLCPLYRWVNLAALQRLHGNWALTRQDGSILGRTNPLKKQNFHDETTKWKTCPSSWSACSPSQNLENVITNFNLSAIYEVIKESCTTKIDETRVGQRVQIWVHDQCKGLDIKREPSGANGCVPMEEISRLASKVSRMESRGPNLSSYRDKSTFLERLIWRILAK